MTVDCVYIPYSNAVVLFGGTDGLTYVYNFDKFRLVGGSTFNGNKKYVPYTRPILVRGVIYVYDYNSKLFGFDLGSRRWHSIA